MSEVTRILQASDPDNPLAADQLLPLVYEELRGIAAHRLAKLPAGQTLQATALVHEAWLRIVDEEHLVWNSRAHFFSAASEAMRRIVVESVRRKMATKRGGGSRPEELQESRIAIVAPSNEVLAIHDALDRLEAENPPAAHLVKLRYFVGMKVSEAAEAMDLPIRSAERLWTYARAWLHREIKE